MADPRGSARDTPLGPNSFIFIQISAKTLQDNRSAPAPLGNPGTTTVNKSLYCLFLNSLNQMVLISIRNGFQHCLFLEFRLPFQFQNELISSRTVFLHTREFAKHVQTVRNTPDGVFSLPDTETNN